MENDLEISYKWYGLGVERMLRLGLGLMTIMAILMHISLTTAIRRGFELYECLLVSIVCSPTLSNLVPVSS